MDIYEDIYGAEAMFTLEPEGPSKEEWEERLRVLEAENASLKQKVLLFFFLSFSSFLLGTERM